METVVWEIYASRKGLRQKYLNRQTAFNIQQYPFLFKSGYQCHGFKIGASKKSTLTINQAFNARRVQGHTVFIRLSFLQNSEYHLLFSAA